MSKEATEAARKKAAETGVEVESVEGSGFGGKVTATDVKEAVESGEAKFLAYANPDLGSGSATAYEDGDVNRPRTFYKRPSGHPDGLEAQMVTEGEFQALNFDIDGVMALVRKGQ